MRTIWNGSLSFGLVTIPVGLAPATKPKARQSDVSFRTLHRECKTPIRQKRWCPTHEREVGPDEIVKGWEVAKGQFVIVEDADLEAIERQSDSRSIEIMQFVNLAALGRMVIRGSEYICLIRPKDDALALETLFVAEDVYSQAEISEAVGETDVQGPELDLARQVIESLVAEFDGQALTSQYRQDL